MRLSTIYCGSLAMKKKKKKVQVIFPSGEVKLLDPPITLGDLLLQYPHHYVAGSSLARDDELLGGSTYLLLPLPRLGIIPSLRRAKSWQPSLHMISESNVLPVQGVCTAETKVSLQKNKEHKSQLAKMDKEILGGAETKPKYSLNGRTWDTGRAKSMEYMSPSAFIF